MHGVRQEQQDAEPTGLDDVTAVGEALRLAALMGWQILWPLVLGFTLSGVVQAVVHREAVSRHLDGDSPLNLAWATDLGAASSSCS